MRWLATLVFLALAFSLQPLAFAGTFDCRWNFIDFTSTPIGVKQVKIQTIAAYGTISSNIITGDFRMFQAGTNGSLTVTNLANGRSYRVTFSGPNFSTVITNSFDTNVTGLVNAVDYLGALIRDGSTVAYSQTAADARFHNVAGDSSTNATFYGTFTLPGGSVAGYVWTATNTTGGGFWSASLALGDIANLNGNGTNTTIWTLLTVNGNQTNSGSLHAVQQISTDGTLFAVNAELMGTLTAAGAGFSGPVTSSSSSTNDPAEDEFVTKKWANDQMATLGAYIFGGGPTNTFAVTNSDEIISRTNVFTGSIQPFSQVSTVQLSGFVVGAKILNIISTNIYQSIQRGPASMVTYTFKSGSGTPTVHYELYAVDATNYTAYRLASSPPQVISHITPTWQAVSMTTTNDFVASNGCYVMVSFIVDAAPSATLYFVRGGPYNSHLTFVRPLSSATIDYSQVTGTPSYPAGPTYVFSGKVTMISNVVVNVIDYTTNSHPSSGNINLAKSFAAFATNNNTTFSGLANKDVGATNAQVVSLFITNSSAAAKTVVMDASFQRMGSADGNTLYVTNVGQLLVFHYPGFGTNFYFKSR
jgi:hypothetical protein